MHCQEWLNTSAVQKNSRDTRTGTVPVEVPTVFFCSTSFCACVRLCYYFKNSTVALHFKKVGSWEVAMDKHAADSAGAGHVACWHSKQCFLGQASTPC